MEALEARGGRKIALRVQLAGLQNLKRKQNPMSLELYFGPMFAGKSSTILGIIWRNKVIHRTTLCITSSLDKRYSQEARITSHNQESHPAVAVDMLMPLLDTPSFRAAHCLIIEEAQFFPDLLDFVVRAVDHHHKHVVCVGLDGDFERKPFGKLLDLIPYADKVEKLKALCMRCRDGTEAAFTHRKAGPLTCQVSVGGQDQYEPLCRRHYLEGRKENAVLNFKEMLNKQEKTTADIHALCIDYFGVSEGRHLYEDLVSREGAGPSMR
jgi:thymidine kinase